MTGERAWLALLAEPAADATATAAVSGADGRPAGHLAAWLRRSKPLREARRVDPRLIDSGGAPARVSLVRPPTGVALAFDDLAVQQARRAVLAGLPFDGVTTLMGDDSHFEGSLVVARGSQVARLADDPFARLFAARLLDVGPGLLGCTLPPAGPTVERYGSERPWPWDRFAGA